MFFLFHLYYSKYAELLAAQGCLETAIGYLMASNDQVCKLFKSVIFRIKLVDTLLKCVFGTWPTSVYFSTDFPFSNGMLRRYFYGNDEGLQSKTSV